VGFLADSQKRLAHSTSLVNLALSRHQKKGSFSHICGRTFITIQCLHCGHQINIKAGSRDRTCPGCSHELYLGLYHKYKPVISGRSDLKLLTLTWKPVEKQAAEIVRAIGQAIVRLFHRKRYARLWKGILAVVECKKTKSGLFYYHVHCIVSGRYVPQSVISRDWKEVSGFPIVDVRAIRRTPKRALRYVLKYMMKGSLFENPDDRRDFKTSMKGVRYVRSYGEFYNVGFAKGRHVYYPCPLCGATKCWVVLDFVDLVDLFEGVPYYPP
jgi:hypothetical protein